MELPLNSNTIFYDGIKKYERGKPPYLFIIKELSNATGGVIYRVTDNRNIPTIVTENELGPFPEELDREKKSVAPSYNPYAEKTSLVGAIWNQSNLTSQILNTYLIKWEKKPEPQLPAGIMNHPSAPDIEQLKKQRLIKYQKKQKLKRKLGHQKDTTEPLEPESPTD